MNKLSTAIIALLLLVIAAGAYKFTSPTDIIQSTDGRTAIPLKAEERDLVLAEMRGFLQTVQQINTGISKDDMKMVAEAAKKMGAAAKNEVPSTLAAKLPMDFKKLAFDTHKKFDQLALDAKDLEDGMQSLSQVATLMENCVACHKAFRFDVSVK